jgi:hypothetical protein
MGKEEKYPAPMMATLWPEGEEGFGVVDIVSFFA